MGARNILRLLNGALEGENQSVEQLTSTSTETTLNSVKGTIETYPSQAAAAGGKATFVFKNDEIKTGSTVIATTGDHVAGLEISSVSVAADAVYTAGAEHGLAVGDVITVVGIATNGDEEPSGRLTVATVPSATTFTVGVETTDDTLTLTDAYASLPSAKRGTTQGAGTPVVSVTNTKSGQCDITIENVHATAKLDGFVPVTFIVLD